MPAGSATGRAPVEDKIAFNTALNLLGLVAPLLAAIVAFPVLNRHLGTERVGFLTLAWALIGYFSLFDLGIGRALTKLVSERLGASDAASLPRLVWTGLVLMMVLGAVAGVAMAAGAGWLVHTALRIPEALRDEATDAVRILALAVPLVVTSAGLRGVLEAQGRFLVANAVRAPMGVWLILGPLLVLPFGSKSLAWIALLLLVGRLAAWLAYAVACVQGIPGLLDGARLSWGEALPLLRFGGWMTVSNVVSPLMVYMDRFLLGGRVSLEAVAWYATPWEMVTKVLIAPGALATVLFPIFSSLMVSDSSGASRIYRLSTRYLALAMWLPTLAISLFAREGLELWLGREFAAQAFRVAQVMALGSFLNAIAHIPFAFVQGAGRPDLTARLHFVELPIYVVLVLWWTTSFGIIGTAFAWVVRAAIDLMALHLAAEKVGGQRIRLAPATIAAGAFAIVTFLLSWLPSPLLVRALALAGLLAAEGWLVWFVLLEHDGLGEWKVRLARRVRLRR